MRRENADRKVTYQSEIKVKSGGLPSRLGCYYSLFMATIIEIQKLALDLPDRERATLAANLLESLPAVLSDEDEGLAEARRRDGEMDADPSQAISFAELDESTSIT
jgi:hypothetical protein